jgi:hypothetical protein
VLKTRRESSGAHLIERLSTCHPESAHGLKRQAFEADYFL